jgi:hypothetical protein
MRGFVLLLFILSILLLIAIVTTAGIQAAKFNAPTPWIELVLMWAPRAFGTLIVVAAGLGLVFRGLYRDRVESTLPLVLALLGGALTLNSGHWAIALAIGAICIAAIISEALLSPRRSSTGAAMPQGDHT